MAPARRTLLASLVLASVLIAVPPWAGAKAANASAMGALPALEAAALRAVPAQATGGSFLGGFTTIKTITSTVPTNGDVNPYGVAVVPRSMGSLVGGDVLVSNFNNNVNPPGGEQGRGTTIVQIAPTGAVSLFAQINPATLPGPCPGGVGLTTALAVLSSGWVIVGSLPTSDGTATTARAGCLLVLNSAGQVVETIANSGINGPWDMAALDLGRFAVLFVTNVLNNGTVAANGAVVNNGTVLRIVLAIPGGKMPVVIGQTVIGSGFGTRTDPAALVIGPTGVGLARNDVLYVADTLENRIAAIPDVLFRGSTAFSGLDVSANGALNGPLGLAIAPNGDVVTVNSGDGNAVETTPSGTQVMTATLDSTTGAGSLFGLAVAPGGSGLYFVDDGTNTLNELTIPPTPRAAATIKGFAFSTPLTVTVGTMVTWTNLDSYTHTVTADRGAFNSGPIMPGHTFSYTFTTAGTFTYHCSFHPYMTGSVIVTP